MENILIATCKSLEYQSGWRELCQGVKGYQSGRSIGGKWFSSRGTGWGEHFESSKLILHAVVDGESEPSEIWIDRFFKDKLGMLTEKRRNAIETTLPPTVRVRKQTSGRGTQYYVVECADLEAWLARAKDALAKMPPRPRVPWYKEPVQPSPEQAAELDRIVKHLEAILPGEFARGDNHYFLPRSFGVSAALYQKLSTKWDVRVFEYTWQRELRFEVWLRGWWPCTFRAKGLSYSGRCGEAGNPYCKQHKDVKCAQCGQQATHLCEVRKSADNQCATGQSAMDATLREELAFCRKCCRHNKNPWKHIWQCR
jgi:hypothetical protein